MVAKQASFKLVSRRLVMTVTKLKHVILKAFYSRRKGGELKSNVELFELFVLTTQVDKRGGLCVNDSTAKSAPKPKQLVT